MPAASLRRPALRIDQGNEDRDRRNPYRDEPDDVKSNEQYVHVIFLSLLRVEHDTLKIYSGGSMRRKIRWRMQQVTRSETAKRRRFYRRASQPGKSLRRWFMW
jgi:hypothetical protein